MVTHKDLVLVTFYIFWLLTDTICYILYGLNVAYTCNLINVLLLGGILIFKFKCKRFKIWLEKVYKKK